MSPCNLLYREEPSEIKLRQLKWARGDRRTESARGDSEEIGGRDVDLCARETWSRTYTTSVAASIGTPGVSCCDAREAARARWEVEALAVKDSRTQGTGAHAETRALWPGGGGAGGAPVLAAVRIRCSPDLLFSVQRVHAHLHARYGRPLPPCRAVCERAKRGCFAAHAAYGFQWPPDELRAAAAPGGPSAALHGPQRQSTSGPPPPPDAAAPVQTPPPPPPSRRPRADPSPPGAATRVSLLSPSSPPLLLFVRVVWRRDTAPAAGCPAPCVRGRHLTAHQQAFTRLWLGLWAAACSCHGRGHTLATS
ncbi:unnamed protein product [Boreogadus saida]